MKKRSAAALFGLLTVVLTGLAIWIALHFQNVPAMILRKPEEAVHTADAVMTAVCEGRYTEAAALMYGNPDLGVDRPASSEVGNIIWEAFQDSTTYELQGDCYAAEQYVCQDVTFRYLDMSSITNALDEHAQALLTARVEQAQDTTQIYDENNEYREAVVNEVLQEATKLALRQNAQYLETSLTLKLTHSDGQWWVVLDQPLLDAISGGIMD